MKIYIFVLSLILASSNFLQGQISQSKITYVCKTQLAKGPLHDGLNTLYFNQDKGLFIHNDFPSENKYVDNGNTTVYVKGDKEGLPVFMNLKDKYLYYKSEYATSKELFIFKDTLPIIDWEIQTEAKSIESFSCIKAVGTFGGRVYDVWFTPDIPVSLGPYKLWGLPGLILEAKSRDGKVSYEFKSYESSNNEIIKLEKPTQGKEITWEDFKKYVINRLLAVESVSTDKYTATNNDPPADYEIERNKFTIIREYKEQRAAKNNKQR